MNPWEGKQLRSMYDTNTQGYWFSAVDLCAALTDISHDAARNYWKQIKHRQNLNKLQTVTESNHLKFKTMNGKYYFTEVMDYKNLIKFIQTHPSPKANPYRLWLTDMMFAGVAIADIEKELAKLGEEIAGQIVEKYKDHPKEQYTRMNVQKEKI